MGKWKFDRRKCNNEQVKKKQRLGKKSLIFDHIDSFGGVKWKLVKEISTQ